MKPSAPTKGVFIVSAILFLIGMLGSYGIVPEAGAYAFWLVALAYIVLAIGNLAKGL